MALSDVEIWAEMNAGYLVIDPAPSADRIAGSSIDLLLHSDLLVLPKADDARLRGITVDPGAVEVMTQLKLLSDKKDLTIGPYTLVPGQFIIGKTDEEVSLPSHLAARIEGRSTLGRLGLTVHITAPTVQTGFHGRLYLEMLNAGPFKLQLTHKMKIAQLIVERLGIPSKNPYQGQFKGQR